MSPKHPLVGFHIIRVHRALLDEPASNAARAGSGRAPSSGIIYLTSQGFEGREQVDGGDCTPDGELLQISPVCYICRQMEISLSERLITLVASLITIGWFIFWLGQRVFKTIGWSITRLGQGVFKSAHKEALLIAPILAIAFLGFVVRAASMSEKQEARRVQKVHRHVEECRQRIRTRWQQQCPHLFTEQTRAATEKCILVACQKTVKEVLT